MAVREEASELNLNILHFSLIDLLLNYGPDFAVTWIEIRAVQRPQVWKFIGVTTVS